MSPAGLEWGVLALWEPSGVAASLRSFRWTGIAPGVTARPWIRAVRRAATS